MLADYAQDPVGPAGSHGRTSDYGGWSYDLAGRTFYDTGHPEPTGILRHIHAAGRPDGPVFYVDFPEVYVAGTGTGSHCQTFHPGGAGQHQQEGISAYQQLLKER